MGVRAYHFGGGGLEDGSYPCDCCLDVVVDVHGQPLSTILNHLLALFINIINC